MNAKKLTESKYPTDLSPKKYGQLWVAYKKYLYKVKPTLQNKIMRPADWQKMGDEFDQTPLDQIYKQIKSSGITMESTTKQKLKEILTPIIKEIIKEIKFRPIAQPYSNLYINGWGLDTNGNWCIYVSFPNSTGFSIQTNGVLPETDDITSRKGKNKTLSETELDTIGKEITDYVKQYGSSNQKAKLRTYQGNG